MYVNRILEKMVNITRQPFLVFANQVEGRTDNAFETLQLLLKEDEVTAGRISEFLDIKPSSVTQIIKKLESAGMAERVKSEKDARVTFVRITEKGREDIADRGSITSTLNEAMFKGLTEEDLVKLDEYLGKIDDNISSEVFQRKLNEIFADDKRWKRFTQMSAHLGRARDQMLENSRFEDFEHFGGFGRPFDHDPRHDPRRSFFGKGRK